MSRLLPNWLSTYMEYSRFSEAPDSFHFWTGVSTIAGALRRKVWINMGYFEWTPNFFIVFVAPPGVVQKSSTADIGMSLLKEIPGINFGPDSITSQALTQALAASTEQVDMPDGTLYPMSALTIVASEFGTFLDPQDRVMVDILVSLWDSKKGEWKKATKTQGADLIENPWLNLIACTTPSWIEGYFPEYLIGGGFTSRTIFVYGEKKRQFVAYPGRHIPKNHEVLREQLVADLLKISMMKGAFTLTEDALEWGETWYRQHYSSSHDHLEAGRFGGYLSRKQTHVHKLAMVLSVSQRDTMEITAQDLKSSVDIITSLEHEMPKVFAKIGLSEAGRFLNDVLRIVQARRRISRIDLYRVLSRSMSLKDFNDTINAAVSANHITYHKAGNDVYLLWKEENGN